MDELKPKGAHNWKHGAYRRNKRLYSIWKTMLHRCENPKREKYQSYGARGIRVCKEWHDPNLFMDWAESNGYSDEMQIDRINNNGNYEPQNCRWVTPKQNSNNRRNTKFITLFGITKSIAEWGQIIPVSEYTMYSWFREHGKDYTEKRVNQALLEVFEHERTA